MSWRARLGEERDIASLALFRVLFGLLVFGSTVRFVASGWVDRFFVQPTIFLKYPGFEWVVAWPEWGMYAHFALIAVLALCVASGLFYRVTAPLLFVAFTYAELIGASLYLNHYYLVSLLSLLLAVMPAHRAWSIDAWRKPSIRSDVAPRWCIALLRYQVALVYIFAALGKVSADWLLHGQPLGIWLSSRSDVPIVGSLLGDPTTALALSWGGFLYDASIWLWLSIPLTRKLAYVAVVAFHLTVGWLLNIGMFPVIMIVATTVFFDRDWPRRVHSALSTRQPPRSVQQKLSWRGAVLLVCFGVVQLALPLRFLAHGGSVNWHERGMRWSWKVVVREKNGAVSYHVTRPDGRRRIVTPSMYLADYQERELSTQPDLIAQLGARIARDYERRYGGPVQVRAEALVSLNGRRAQLLVDPTVDIADGAPNMDRWILPEPSEPPLGARLRKLAVR